MSPTPDARLTASGCGAPCSGTDVATATLPIGIVTSYDRQLSACAVEGVELKVESEHDLTDLVDGTDLFVLCADQPAPREICLWTNRVTLATRTPWLMSFYAGPMVVVGAQRPLETPCYECLRHWAEEEGKVDDGIGALNPNLRVNAVIGPSAAIAGSFAALEAVYMLAGLRPQTLGRIFHQSLTTYDFAYWREGGVWADCTECGPYRTAARERSA